MANITVSLSIIEAFQLEASLLMRRSNLEAMQRSQRAKRKGPNPTEYEQTIEQAIHYLRRIETKIGEALNETPHGDLAAAMSAMSA